MKSQQDLIDLLPKPDYTAGIEAYQRELVYALKSDPRRRKNYEKYMSSDRRKAKVDYLPIRLDIENASRCNLRCTMCVVSDWRKGQRAADMTLVEFKRLIDMQYGLVEIKLNGLGEALLMGDQYFEMIRYARSKHIWVRLVTNGSLLHIKENYKKLIDADPNEIQMSVDGPNKGVFEKIRRGSKFGQIIQNMKMINTYDCEKGLRRTKMWTVVQRDNVDYLEELVDLAAEVYFPDMVFSLELQDWGLDRWNEINSSVSVANELSYDRLNCLVSRGAALGVRVMFWSLGGVYSTKSKDQLCPWPFERSLISSDSRTVPCCMIANPDTFEIGADSGKGFTELWHSAEYEAFRQRHLDGNIPRVCSGCYRFEEH